VLRELPFKTIGDIARHGLELHVHCSRCFATRRLDLEVNTALHGRAFATTRFRCRRCGTPGLQKIRPTELLQVGRLVTLAFLWCNSCIWELDHAQLDKPHGRAAGSALAAPAAVVVRVAHTWAGLATPWVNRGNAAQVASWNAPFLRVQRGGLIHLKALRDA
jgi:hypothetical protein